jgi:hypothetical protein
MTKCPDCGLEMPDDDYVRCPSCRIELDPSVPLREAKRDRDLSDIAKVIRIWFFFPVAATIVGLGWLIWLSYKLRPLSSLLRLY